MHVNVGVRIFVQKSHRAMSLQRNSRKSLDGKVMDLSPSGAGQTLHWKLFAQTCIIVLAEDLPAWGRSFHETFELSRGQMG
jgi:hypothetical protein